MWPFPGLPVIESARRRVDRWLNELLYFGRDFDDCGLGAEQLAEREAAEEVSEPRCDCGLSDSADLDEPIEPYCSARMPNHGYLCTKPLGHLDDHGAVGMSWHNTSPAAGGYTRHGAVGKGSPEACAHSASAPSGDHPTSATPLPELLEHAWKGVDLWLEGTQPSSHNTRMFWYSVAEQLFDRAKLLRAQQK